MNNKKKFPLTFPTPVCYLTLVITNPGNKCWITPFCRWVGRNRDMAQMRPFPPECPTKLNIILWCQYICIMYRYTNKRWRYQIWKINPIQPHQRWYSTQIEQTLVEKVIGFDLCFRVAIILCMEIYLEM